MSGSRNLTEQLVRGLCSPIFNLRPPRPGLYFDGTTSARMKAVLTGQTIGTDNFSVVWTMGVRTTNPSSNENIWGLSPDDDASAPYDDAFAYYDTSGSLVFNFRLTGGSPVDAVRTLSNFISNYGGQTVICALVRSGSSLTLYINGVAKVLTGTSGSVAMSLTGLYFSFGGTPGATACAVMSLHSATLYNLALSLTDAEEIFFLGGAVPYRYQFGSQAALQTNGTFASDTAWSKGAGWTIAAGVASRDGTGGTSYLAGSSSPIPSRVVGKVFQFNYDITAYTAGGVYGSMGGYQNTTSRTAIGSYSDTVIPTNPGSDSSIYFGGNGFNGSIDNVVVRQVGAVAHYSLDEGIGYQLHDASTNKLDAVMTITGVAHLVPQRRGYVRTPGAGLSWTASSTFQSVLGQRAFPDGVAMVLLTAKSTASTTGTGTRFGSTNDNARWSALAALVANTKVVRTIANSGLPAGVANSDTDFGIQPDSVNFTGVIQAEAHYVQTEG